MTVNDELKGCKRKQLFKILFQHLSGGTEEIREKLQSG